MKADEFVNHCVKNISVAHDGTDDGIKIDCDLQEKSCSSAGNTMNFINQYIHVQKLKAQKDLINLILEDYKKEIVRVMTTEGYMTTEDYHYLFALKEVRNYLLNKKIGINNRLCEWDTFDKCTSDQIIDYINSFKNDSIIQCEEKGLKPRLK